MDTAPENLKHTHFICWLNSASCTALILLLTIFKWCKAQKAKKQRFDFLYQKFCVGKFVQNFRVCVDVSGRRFDTSSYYSIITLILRSIFCSLVVESFKIPRILSEGEVVLTACYKMHPPSSAIHHSAVSGFLIRRFIMWPNLCCATFGHGRVSTRSRTLPPSLPHF